MDVLLDDQIGLPAQDVETVFTERLLLIGNNRGGLNGWISRSSIFGRLIRVEA